MLHDLSMVMINKRATRIAVSALFFLTGLCFSSWASRIPDIQLALNLNDAGLGSVLLALPVGSIISLPVAGILVSKYGSRQILLIAAVAYAAVLPVLGLAHTSWELSVFLVFFGFFGNLANIAVNTQAVGVEAMYGRSIMASFHGLWSVAGFTGAAFGTWMTGLHLAPVYHFLIITAVSWILIVITMNRLVVRVTNENNAPSLFGKPDAFLFTLGIIAMCSMICEGTMFDWSGVYFRRVIQVREGWSGAGYAAFMSTMASGRFVADYLTTRLGVKKMLLISGGLTASGLLVAVIFPYFVPAMLGFMLVGAGVSAVVPLVYSAAGKSTKLPPGMALATVSTIGYFGFLFGPPLIGFVAQATNLGVAFTMIAVMGAAIAVMSSRIKL
ncbi:Fucose permease [Chitinophaga ginsengisegetis]|uniref:Fucose permease n=1 Tax=Chitinophaga ginsengisegetis TaxID=393003 RepID=A0A1T5P5K7_9BACT|nr:MFS transporter [Chitinophaga ginsengisegetis]MDR6566398.1 MFS family permease [Chitinophaga ginsengisegetis]MDR6646128.1 MFS family permease [Chitinophaga ginsengisegetis]MDR6651280.1 MFS family permease [Chitinophaga ginsengisegetis]SKD08070.1 Fucose permease [Chitinophaga ginsengisegetis]